jgi:hypothetical protein
LCPLCHKGLDGSHEFIGTLAAPLDLGLKLTKFCLENWHF